MPVRYLLVAATFLLSVLLYVDRVCISAAKGRDRGRPAASATRQLGWVFAAFSLGYALFQTPAGHARGPLRAAAGPDGGRRLLVAVHGADGRGPRSRVDAGRPVPVRGGRGGGIPRHGASDLRVAADGRARAGAGDQLLGRAAGGGRRDAGRRLDGRPAGLAAHVSSSWASSGFVWAWRLVSLVPRRPGDPPRALATRSADYILDHRQAAPPMGRRMHSSAIVLGSVDMWLLMAQYFASNFTFFFCLTWLFPHLASDVRPEPGGGRLVRDGAAPGGHGGQLGGRGLVDAIYRRGHWRASRRLPAMLGFALAGRRAAGQSGLRTGSAGRSPAWRWPSSAPT